MKNSKFIALLQTFSGKEIKRFVAFAQSPYFNKNKNVTALCEVLAKAYPTFEDKKVAKATLFRCVFGAEKPYHDATMRNLVSDVLQLADAFLVQENLALSPVEKDLYAARDLIMRDAFALAEKKLASLDAQLNQAHHTEGFYYQWRMLYYRLTDYLYYKQQKIALRNEALQAKLDNLFHYFCLDLFNLYSVMLNLQQTSTAHAFNFEAVSAVWEALSAMPYSIEPQIAIAYHMAALSRPNATLANYQTLSNALQQHRHQLSSDLVIRVNVFLANYLLRHQAHQTSTRALCLQCYLDNIALHQQRGEPIPAWLFNSIADFAYAVYGKVWALQFIEDYQHHLLPATREGWLNLAQARICFYEGNYADTIALIANNVFFHEQGYFYGKPFMLYAYFEQDNYDAFYGLLDSMKHTLRRRSQELSPFRYEALKNTLDLLPQLYRLRHKPDTDLRRRLSAALQHSDTPFHAREWLAQKLGIPLNEG